MSRRRIIARKIAGKLVDFICFFFLSCFITTCSIMMFAHGADFTVEYITARARGTVMIMAIKRSINERRRITDLTFTEHLHYKIIVLMYT